MVVLDTDSLTLIQRQSGDAYQRLDVRLEDAVGNGHAITTTIVSVEEQMRGWLAFIANARTVEKQVEAYRRLREFLLFLQDRQILDFEDRAARQLQHLRKQRVRIGTMDLKIASIALANGAILISRNLSHFRNVPGLQVEDWTVSQA